MNAGLLLLAIAIHPAPPSRLEVAIVLPEIAPPETAPLVSRTPQLLADPAFSLASLPPADAALQPAIGLAAAPAADPATSSKPASQRDPLHGFNRLSYRISQPIDRFVIRPVAMAYVKIVPHPLRDGLRNFLNNLFEPVVFVNDLLQLRFRRAARTAARTLINTAVGAGGLFDVAKRHYINLPGHPNGFGDTLGYYGIGPGPYLYIPVLGPTTLRDAVGSLGDFYTQPRLLNKIFHPDNDNSVLHSKPKLGFSNSIAEGIGGIDERARADDALAALSRASVDPYASLRASYLQNRAGEIAALQAKDGAVPAIPSLDDPLIDPGATSPSRVSPSRVSPGAGPGDAATLPTATTPAPAQTLRP